jgi:hypothetical protein
MPTSAMRFTAVEDIMGPEASGLVFIAKMDMVVRRKAVVTTI